jgi:hypothetical protein
MLFIFQFFLNQFFWIFGYKNIIYNIIIMNEIKNTILHIIIEILELFEDKEISDYMCEKDELVNVIEKLTFSLFDIYVKNKYISIKKEIYEISLACLWIILKYLLDDDFCIRANYLTKQLYYFTNIKINWKSLVTIEMDILKKIDYKLYTFCNQI